MIYWASALLSMKGYSSFPPVSVLKRHSLVMFINVILIPPTVFWNERTRFQNANANLNLKGQNGMIVLVQVRTSLLYLSLKG